MDEIVPNQHEQRHDGEIVNQEEDHRLGIIVEHEMAPEQQIEADVSAVERKCAIKRPELAGKAQAPCPQRRGLQVLAHHRQHHAPVKPQMQAHADKAPVGAEEMRFLRRFIAAVLRQKQKYIP